MGLFDFVKDVGRQLFDTDDEGYAILLVDGDVPADLEEKARLAADNVQQQSGGALHRPRLESGVHAALEALEQLGHVDRAGTGGTITNLSASTQYVINIWTYDKCGNNTAATASA